LPGRKVKEPEGANVAPPNLRDKKETCGRKTLPNFEHRERKQQPRATPFRKKKRGTRRASRGKQKKTWEVVGEYVPRTTR